MPTDPKPGSVPAETPPQTEPKPEPASPEVPQTGEEEYDPFEEGNFPV